VKEFKTTVSIFIGLPPQVPILDTIVISTNSLTITFLSKHDNSLQIYYKNSFLVFYINVGFNDTY